MGKLGRKPYLNEYAEKLLADRIHFLCNHGRGPSTDKVREIIRNHVQKQNKFANKILPLSPNWLSRFMKRHNFEVICGYLVSKNTLKKKAISAARSGSQKNFTATNTGSSNYLSSQNKSTTAKNPDSCNSRTTTDSGSWNHLFTNNHGVKKNSATANPDLANTHKTTTTTNSGSVNIHLSGNLGSSPNNLATVNNDTRNTNTSTSSCSWNNLTAAVNPCSQNYSATTDSGSGNPGSQNNFTAVNPSLPNHFTSSQPVPLHPADHIRETQQNTNSINSNTKCQCRSEPEFTTESILMKNIRATNTADSLFFSSICVDIQTLSRQDKNELKQTILELVNEQLIMSNIY